MQDTEQCADLNSRRPVCTEEIKKNPNFINTGGSCLGLKECQTFQSTTGLLITRLDYKSIIKSNNYGLKTRNQKLFWLQQTSLTPQGLCCLLSILCAFSKRKAAVLTPCCCQQRMGLWGPFFPQDTSQFPGSSWGIA